MKEIKSQSEIDSLVKGSAIVIFSADWSSVCTATVQAFDKIASKYSSVQMVQIDIDESDGLKKKYDVTAVPTTFAFKSGKQTQKFVGPMPIESQAETFAKNAV